MGRSGAILCLALAALAAAACGPESAEPVASTAEGGTSATTAIDAGLGVELHLPGEARGSAGATLIVLVPGGGWESADPGGLVPLASDLAAAGAVSATITYRTASEGAYYPEPAIDVACAVARAAAEAGADGTRIDHIVVLGHSAGAHLAALVALRPAEFGDECADPPVAPDRLVGLAGPYDVAGARGPAFNLFGPDNTDPAGWSEGNPVEHASSRPELDVLLIHGRSDDLVPVRFTEQFAAALSAGGHRVTAVYPGDVDHHSIYASSVAAPLILDWLALDGAG